MSLLTLIMDCLYGFGSLSSVEAVDCQWEVISVTVHGRDAVPVFPVDSVGGIQREVGGSEMEQVTLLHGDALEVLRTLPDNSVDAIVTDPPGGISFMGREWDSDKGGRDNWIAAFSEIARECLRVVKPGAHALVWAIPRTSHWTATARETLS